MNDPSGGGGVEERCERLEYPVMRADAAAAFSDVTVDANGDETNLGVVVSESERDSFANPEELYAELEAAVGEPL
ncbi:hypothetical protein C2R22_08645 [Salinigranum rubrum]|uniref:DUF2795 domain-containing protein n=1 Tax=Salinigranum rubrum TaxID=755307 RepID=A0A2I8VIF4_9EURY|nr:hypothetical protein [Salinigranum rubrum]AUV81708.1 hypothetical protein C2R22_08645 [Salinigranum rubrum]